eukprot:scaffold818_cov136-Cylindrotheca_fusiformis.AAC.35
MMAKEGYILASSAVVGGASEGAENYFSTFENQSIKICYWNQKKGPTRRLIPSRLLSAQRGIESEHTKMSY